MKNEVTPKEFEAARGLVLQLMANLCNVGPVQANAATDLLYAKLDGESAWLFNKVCSVLGEGDHPQRTWAAAAEMFIMLVACERIPRDSMLAAIKISEGKTDA